MINTSSDESVRPPQRELLCQMQYLEDRLRRLESMATEVRWNATPEVYRRLLSQELGNGLFRFYEVVPRTGQDYWDRFAKWSWA